MISITSASLDCFSVLLIKNSCLQVAESGVDQCEVTITGDEKARGRNLKFVLKNPLFGC